ncbi:MAG: tripartite tricarboxylate transporter TctB family protein [Rhodocyclaceae bacterium]
MKTLLPARNRDTLAGIVFVLFGLAFAIGAGAYDMGSAARMGPGFFPRMLGGVLVVLGVAVFAVGARAPVMAGLLRGFPLRPLLAICAAIAVFALLLEKGGLALASWALVMVSAAGQRKPHWREAFVAAVVLTAVAVLVFAYGLKLPLNVWPRF